jgi:hypothetical protein
MPSVVRFGFKTALARWPTTIDLSALASLVARLLSPRRALA